MFLHDEAIMQIISFFENLIDKNISNLLGAGDGELTDKLIHQHILFASERTILWIGKNQTLYIKLKNLLHFYYKVI